ncbi:hypothetical protein VTN96DRAFT_2350 [Rasamsonia emersonii]|uniref:1-aminocyclopropane-1-carboxylate deaminase n=1 Tax=Rasamsonia emersonii (strain ATCC 16479 / CBS 393.64 / IMI 116815) TaxID=1408163 RepID=A0A0F4YXC5_RASE3|nr:1-aminocyclopropane-1-carboxylate deaminase [Rasamsonia emersonii CBS 393.64]KKA22889.1 1-aminocyclopropane-1-carboxylate deaminase [Rasamsonia emersonii CBS 393.64]
MAATVPLPEPFASIPRESLLFGPSPIQRLERISSDLSAASSRPVHIFAKRDDCNSGLAFGGNKTRKLEYFIADALAQGADTLVSVGGIQSNHTRQVAAVAAKFALKCSLLQEHWVPGDDAPNYDRVANLQLSRLMSAKVTIGPEVQAVGTKDNLFTHQDDKVRLATLCDEVRQNGGKPYLIPAGASDHPLGGLGFARWAFEVAEQEKTMGVFFNVIVVCAVTGSTMAGIIAGFKLLEKQPGQEGKRRKIIGVDASARPRETHATVLRLARQTGEKIGLQADDITADDVILDPRYHAGSYGVPDEQTIAAIKYGASMEAFITDPVYEGKSFAGMIDMARKGEFEENSYILYAHLGGQLALNSYADIIA